MRAELVARHASKYGVGLAGQAAPESPEKGGPAAESVVQPARNPNSESGSLQPVAELDKR